MDWDKVLHDAIDFRVVERLPGSSRPHLVRSNCDGVQFEGIFKSIINQRNEIKLTISSDGCSHAHREVTAYEISKQISFNWVPPTAIKKIDGKEGSLQLFIDNLVANPELTPLDRYKIGVFDFVIGNTDRHFNNCRSNSDGIYLIDNGLSFPIGENLGLMEFKCCAMSPLNLERAKIEHIDYLIPYSIKQDTIERISSINLDRLTYLNMFSEEEVDLLRSRILTIVDFIRNDSVQENFYLVHRRK